MNRAFPSEYVTSRASFPVLETAFAGVVAADVVGFLVMVKSRRATVRQALLTGTPLNAPLPFVAVQALVLAAARPGTRTSTAASATVAALGAVSIASGFFDGGYAAEGYDLSVAERGIQGAIVAATAGVTAAAATQTTRTRATGSN